MSTVRWSDIGDKHVAAIRREDVERGTSRFIYVTALGGLLAVAADFGDEQYKVG